MVYVQGGDNPKFSHLTEAEAVTEAERLCRTLRRDAFVLKAIKKVRIANPPTEIIEITEHASDR